MGPRAIRRHLPPLLFDAPDFRRLWLGQTISVFGDTANSGTVLGENKINIANFSLGRRENHIGATEPADAVALGDGQIFAPSHNRTDVAGAQEALHAVDSHA